MESINIGGTPAAPEPASTDNPPPAPAIAAAPDPAPQDPTPTQDGDALSVLPKRVKLPEDTRGHYIVLVARVPKRGGHADYREVACVKAHDPDHAKRLALEEDGRSPLPHDQRREVARALLQAATEGKGILLRAVPAMHWPDEIEPTTFVRPAPVLQIG